MNTEGQNLLHLGSSLYFNVLMAEGRDNCCQGQEAPLRPTGELTTLVSDAAVGHPQNTGLCKMLYNLHLTYNPRPTNRPRPATLLTLYIQTGRQNRLAAIWINDEGLCLTELPGLLLLLHW
ncbi:hypothetical protein CBL_03504 [Carabus blaptoides fortunei]